MALSVCSTDFLVIRFSRYRPTEMFYQFFIHKTCMKCGVTNDIGRTKSREDYSCFWNLSRSRIDY